MPTLDGALYCWELAARLASFEVPSGKTTSTWDLTTSRSLFWALLVSWSSSSFMRRYIDTYHLSIRVARLEVLNVVMYLELSRSFTRRLGVMLSLKHLDRTITADGLLERWLRVHFQSSFSMDLGQIKCVMKMLASRPRLPERSKWSRWCQVLAI